MDIQDVVSSSTSARIITGLGIPALTIIISLLIIFSVANFSANAVGEANITAIEATPTASHMAAGSAALDLVDVPDLLATADPAASAPDPAASTDDGDLALITPGEGPRVRQATRGIDAPLGGNTLQAGDTTRLVVMAVVGDPAEGYYESYPASHAGVNSALTDLHQSGDPSSSYVMYVGANITGIPVARYANTEAPGTFSGLAGRIHTLVITGNAQDPINTAAALNAAPTERRQFTRGDGDSWFGSHIILRNVQHRLGSNVYMKGHNLTLGGSSWQTAATNYFGGSNTGNITSREGTTTLTVYSTGTGDSNFFGGMNAGTFTGNTAIVIRGSSGNAIMTRGGGSGTDGARAHVMGNVSTTITGLDTRTWGLSSFLGGVHYGNISGQITNHISGPGRFVWTGGSTSGDVGGGHYVGGSRTGSVGGADTIAAPIKTDGLDMDYSPLLDNTNYAIFNDIDTSAYTNGRKYFIGANTAAGTITGNVINVVKAGTVNAGGLTGLQALGGIGTTINNTWPSALSGSTSTGRVTGIERARELAESQAGFRVYGNAVTVVRAGHITAGGDINYYRGAGYGGYIEGDIYSAIGTEGLVYQTTLNTYQYRVNPNAGISQGYSTTFDLVGGGGREGWNDSTFIAGDTHIVLKEVRARWTYGSSFGGVLQGDSLIELHAGVVDTLEGAGYLTYVHVGDSRAEVHGGQVEWFLSGGGWNDHWHDGNVSVEVFDGPPPNTPIINASMGGTYGNSTAHYTSGDSTMVIRGGDFSGVPRRGPSGFSSGPTNAGYIFGNASMTLDLRGNQHGFKTSAANAVSAGRSTVASGDSYLGFNHNNTIELNIFTDDDGGDLLSRMNIYGDASASGVHDRTRSGHITMNINAPGSTIGNLYATSYVNLTGTATSRMLWRNVEMNLVSAANIEGLSAGNGFTDTGAGADTNTLRSDVAQRSIAAGRQAIIKVGPHTDDPAHPLGERETTVPENGRPRVINVAGVGITGFTRMDITRRLLTATDGTVKNGGARASLATFAEYNNHGSVYLHAGQGVDASGFGIRRAGQSLIVAGDLHVVGEGTAYIQSQGALNQAVFNDVHIADTLTWLRVGDTSAANFSPLTSWFGAARGWHVFTLNPQRERALKVSPFNLEGIDESNGHTYLGDSVVPSSGASGFAVCIPGAKYRWQVTAGEGMVTHDVDITVSTGETPSSPVHGIGSVGKGVPSQSGMIAVPSEFVPDPMNYPTFSFIPHAPRGEWVEGVQIHRSDCLLTDPQHSLRCITIPEVPLPDYHQDYVDGLPPGWATWTAQGDDRYFSFDIAAQYTHDCELQARSVIITESEAAAIADAGCITGYQEAMGRPFFRHDIDDALLAAIRQPLADGLYLRSHPVTYSTGRAVTGDVASAALTTLTVKVVVVRDGSVLSEDRSYGVWAKDARMTLSIAQEMQRERLDSRYTHAMAFTSQGTTDTPTLAAGVLEDIRSSTAEQVPRDVVASYSFLPADAAGSGTADGQTLVPASIDVIISIIPNWPTPTGLRMSSVRLGSLLLFPLGLAVLGACGYAGHTRRTLGQLMPPPSQQGEILDAGHDKPKPPPSPSAAATAEAAAVAPEPKPSSQHVIWKI
ncbi:MAG: hypothetical protein FWE46_00345 [Coriobacteriia bacterium]|nr:hypothetical protein [Coriobacteriia bacterium]MCL2536772.1 hypothetical protein [Coriobacteriia bacterium]